MKLSELPKMTKAPIYGADVPLSLLEGYVEREIKDYGLVLEPDFQRGHVWTQAQRVAFMEYKLRGGPTGRDILLNHPGWGRNYKGDFVLVDGLQRLTTFRMFLRDEVPVFGAPLSAYEDREMFMRSLDIHLALRFNVNDLRTRAQVLAWYLEINTGGTPHSDAEIARVRALHAAAVAA